eukprot:TRINITY_DN10082_c0_g1_i2.p1 TRINITY_DN10082_c0_g1~~TRINITY_DN10082_c0_g1_i2.p1  ORF type:complete len:182 (+),score=44.35 TRINITY_DN10082_c0_g1_i2:37-546(+)
MLCCGTSTVLCEPCERDVFLNIYDMTSFNTLTGLVGMGAHHTGVQVYNREYCFGRGCGDTGVYSIVPKTSEGHIYRETHYLGRTKLSYREMNALLKNIKRAYPCDMYHIIRCNCNDFSKDFAEQLLNGTVHFPAWVNRPSRSALWLLPSHVVDRLDHEIQTRNKQLNNT